MTLDISTLYLVATLVAAMLGALLLLIWRQENIPALGWWGFAYLLGAVSIALSTWAGAYLGDILQLGVAMTGYIACGLVWTASRAFHGRKPNVIGVATGPLVWLAVNLLVPPEHVALRTFIGAGIVAVYAALTASELWSERRQTLKSRWPAILVPTLHGAVLMLPIILGELLQPEGRAVDATSGWVALFAIELVLYAVGTVFVVTLLVNERAVRVHKAAASMDPMTGLLNRRGFGEATARMIEREAKAGRKVTVMIFDIDRFKSINDRFGHPAGDEIIKLFSIVVTNALRISDLVGRIGGEEFAALLPCGIDEALIAAERVRVAFEASGIEVDDEPIATTVSIGVAGGPPRTELDILLASADTALYQAKRTGRNRVIAATEEPLSLEQGRRLTAARATAPRVVAQGAPELAEPACA